MLAAKQAHTSRQMSRDAGAPSRSESVSTAVRVSDESTARTAVVEAARSEARTTSPPAGGTDDTIRGGATEDEAIAGGTDDATFAGGTEEVTLAGGTDDETVEGIVDAGRARTDGTEGAPEGGVRRGDDAGGTDAELVSDRAGGAVGGGRGAEE